MEILDRQNYVRNGLADSVNALIPFKEKMKNLYKLDQTATNGFDKLIFKMLNENFRKHEAMILKLTKVGHVQIKYFCNSHELNLYRVIQNSRKIEFSYEELIKDTN